MQVCDRQKAAALRDSEIRNHNQNLTAPQQKPIEAKFRALKIRPDELLRQYGAGERDFRGINLSDQTLNRVNLSGVNFSQANLANIVLEKANLTGINLSRADLSKAKLKRAELNWANLQGANLEGANLRGADLTGANLTGANLTGVDLGGAILPDGSIVFSSKQSSLLSMPSKRHLGRNK